MQWGAEMNQYVSGLTGQPGVFARQVYGEFGRVTWIGGFASFDDLDTANEKIGADPLYVQRLDGAGPLFRPGTVSVTLAERLGS